MEFDNGQSAYQYLRSESNRTFSFAMIDILMPQMDGIELARRIRTEYPDWKVKLVAITGNLKNIPRQEDRDYFDKILSKPFKMQQINSLEEYLIDTS
jgi:CheY-like chemotaxis protein